MTSLNSRVSAFTLLESLVVLLITSFTVIALSASVSQVFKSIEEELFYLSFEQLYRDTQKLSCVKQEKMTLHISEAIISNGVSEINIPDLVQVPKDYTIHFNQSGGNSSLSKVIFKTLDKEVSYQLYIGSGNYKKTENKSLHSP